MSITFTSPKAEGSPIVSVGPEGRAELFHVNRVASIGRLTASIAHELNQPLAVVLMCGENGLRWLSEEPADIGKAKRCLEGVNEAALRASDIMTCVRDLCRKSSGAIEQLDINEAISDVVTLTRGQAVANGVTLHTRLSPRLPCVQGNRVQLQQVVLNLIINAIQAMSSVGDNERNLLVSSQLASERVSVAVRDTGPGLSPEVVSRLFEPFYTTKPDGLGIGLSLCQSIVEAHGGKIRASGCKPRGAEFQFTLPVESKS